MKFSKRVENLNFSETIKIADRVREFEVNGHKIIQLSGGQPHLPTHENIKIAALRAINDNHVFYSHSRGVYQLRKLLTEKYNKKYGTLLDPDQNILITPGCKQAILYFILATIDDGDEVVIPTPSWMSYGEMVKVAGGNPVFVECEKKKNFELSVDLIEQSLTSKTKVIILNSPNNPTGLVIKKRVLEDISRLCIEKDIFLLCDEVYEQIVFDGFNHISIAGINKDFRNCVLINGFSKAYSMTGWRLGYVIAQFELVDNMLKFQQNSVTCPVTFAQFGAIEAAMNGDDFVKKTVAIYQQNRDFLATELDRLSSFDYILPQGTFYMFVNVSKIDNDVSKFCLDLLERCKIAAVPGSAFGNNAQGYIRINLATKRENLKIFVKKLKECYESGPVDVKYKNVHPTC